MIARVAETALAVDRARWADLPRRSEDEGSRIELQSRSLLRRAVCGMLATALELRHGGSVVISNSLELGSGFTSLGTQAGPISLGRLSRIHHVIDPTDALSAKKVDEVMHAARVVAQLTAVDGAVLLDETLGVRSFGAVFQGVESTPCRWAPPGASVESAIADWNELPEFDIEAKGTRHRSAARFCARNPGSVVFVISQDREMRCFEGLDEGRAVVRGPLSSAFTRSTPL